IIAKRIFGIDMISDIRNFVVVHTSPPAAALACPVIAEAPLPAKHEVAAGLGPRNHICFRLKQFYVRIQYGTWRPPPTGDEARNFSLAFKGCRRGLEKFKVKAFTGARGEKGENMRIAVLGGGHGSYAAAADFSEAGHEVRLWRRNADALRELSETRTICLRDFKGSRPVTIAVVTADIGEAVAGANLIVAPTPAFAQPDIAKNLAPHLTDGQVIFLPPGTFGSYLMMKVLRDNGCTAEVMIAETGTLPWLTRKRAPGEIAITTRATRLPTGVFPARLTDK